MIATFAGLLLAATAPAACGGDVTVPESVTSSGSTSTGGQGTGGTGGNAGAGGMPDIPLTCDDAAVQKGNVGCEFWPTVTPSYVWSVFDFAVAVANPGPSVAAVTVTRAGQSISNAEIQPGSSTTIYLPWVTELKGPDFGPAGSLPPPFTESVRVPGGGYHLTSSVPVVASQFNPIEHAAGGGPPGKDWGACPGPNCRSFSNDASLLLPTTALSGSYRVLGSHGWPEQKIGSYVVLTATADATVVDIRLAAGAELLAGDGVNPAGPGQAWPAMLDRGDVLLLLGPPSGDWSGTLVSASQPIQMLHGVECVQMPLGQGACDHVEESVFPTETLGRRYIVTPPTGPNGDAPGHVVRLYGNFDGTVLEYPGSLPPNAPAMLDAGQVVDLSIVTTSFEVQGNQPFGVATFQLGLSLVDPDVELMDNPRGDPAASLVIPVEQFRSRHMFVAPVNFEVNYLDIVQPLGASVTLDGQPVAVPLDPVGETGFGIARVKLVATTVSHHLVEASEPVGLQVSGYGPFTSYYYPAGLHLAHISPAPTK